MSQMMGVETEIEGKKYIMYMLGPMASHDLLMDVVKMVGPALGPVFDMFFSKMGKEDVGSVMDEEIGADFFSKAAGDLFGGLNKKVLRDVINTFSKVTHVDGVPLDKVFEAHFKGDLGSMYSWIIWGMKVQWGKSFGALVNMIGEQGARIKEETESPSPTD